MKLFTITFLLLTTIVSGEGLEGVTIPSADVSASFTSQTLITEVFVKEGQAVKKGQLLAVQNKEVQEQELLRLKKEAAASALIHRAKTEVAFLKKDFDNLQEAIKKGATSRKELNDTELALRKAELSLKEAEFAKELAELKVKELKSKLKQYELRSPVDGIIEKLEIEKGESPRPGEEHIRIVSVKPMWVEVPVPREIAIKLKSGISANVIFPEGKTVKGKVIFISLVADTASDTVRVKIELNNAIGRLVGERVKVDFSVK